MNKLIISVVSHGHGDMILKLIGNLNDEGAKHIKKLIVTFNIPEVEVQDIIENDKKSGKYAFNVEVKANKTQKGFGVNHNSAFNTLTEEEMICGFAVINPDVSWQHAPWMQMLSVLEKNKVGAVYCDQYSQTGFLQDSVRRWPTFTRIIKRALSIRQISSGDKVDWVNAALIVFKTNVYKEIRGFDERYVMYCEDVDICLRMKLRGYELGKAEAVSVVHTGQRSSHRSIKHFIWHVKSLFRFWFSDSYKKYKKSATR